MGAAASAMPMAMIMVGANDTPAANTASDRPSRVVDPQQRQRGGRRHRAGDGQHARQGHGQAHRAERQSGQAGTQRIHGQHDAGARRTPDDAATATLITSMTPTITPIAASMNVSLRKAATPSTVGSRPARAGFSGGAVRVCRLNAVMPTASSAAAASGPA